MWLTKLFVVATILIGTECVTKRTDYLKGTMEREGIEVAMDIITIAFDKYHEDYSKVVEEIPKLMADRSGGEWGISKHDDIKELTPGHTTYSIFKVTELSTPEKIFYFQLYKI